jgi:predicted nuclease of predicted toxin-antitoxin system
MNFHAFRFLTDENIHPEIIEFLRSESFDVASTSELALNGKPDDEILKRALSDKRVIITQDNDFGKLVFANKEEFVGIIYLRPGHIASNFHIKTLQSIMAENPDLQPPFLLVAEHGIERVKIRIRNAL